MALTVSIAFSYSNDPAVQAALKEFHVWASDPVTKARLGTMIVVPKTPPTTTTPLAVPLLSYGAQQVEVTPIDLTGKEGAKFYGPVSALLPAITGFVQTA